MKILVVEVASSSHIILDFCLIMDGFLSLQPPNIFSISLIKGLDYCVGVVDFIV